MSRLAWTINFSGKDGSNPGFVSRTIKNALFDLRFHKDSRSWPHQTPSSIKWSRAPGQERRTRFNEKSRQLLRWEANQMITQILSKNKIMNPPQNLAEIAYRMGRIPK
ncbi:unnamed protein product [Blepharisma stoltei]|uniref:Ribosomal protein S3 n=1 Tax=Blepharisma stoltei TaxID=1481888 RepID=A0AAU9IUI6_9CILI|nr:unnamed protein product [Blepharisma stoltei]